MGRINDLRVGIVQSIEQRFLNVCVNMRFGFLNEQEVGERLRNLLVFELKKLEGKVDEVRAAQA